MKGRTNDINNFDTKLLFVGITRDQIIEEDLMHQVSTKIPTLYY